MQKKIIALAVAGLVSGGAFAQSNVTISGLFDAGLVQSKGDTGSNSSWNAGFNNTGTSQVTLAAREDLGGGMRAGVVLETDIRGSATTGAAAAGINGAALGGFQHYVFLGKAGIGDLSFGQRTNMMTTSLTTVQPFGTSMGGGDGGSFTRTRGGGFEAYGVWSATGRDVRPEGAAHFRSDSFSGISFGLDFKPKNSATGETQASNGYLGIGANYNNGPMNFTFTSSKASNTTAAAQPVAMVNAICATAAGVYVAGASNSTCVGATDVLMANGTAAVAAVLPFDGTVKNTAFGGNYTMGPATIYAGWTRSKADTSNAAILNADSASWNIGVKYTMGNLAFLFNTIKDNDKLAADADRKLTALGVDYSLSKRTTAYARLVTQDTDLSSATGNGAGKLTQTALGLKHTF